MCERINLNRKYRTRDGREVRLLVVDGQDEFPVMGLIKESDGRWCATKWRADGSWLAACASLDDLIEVTEAMAR